MKTSFQVAVALAMSATVPMGAQQPQQQQVVSTVQSIFAAATTDDIAKFESLVEPSFYLYEAGHRFNGDSIMMMIKALHAKGVRYTWNVTEPDVHIDGSTAWIAYVNRGTITDTSGTKDAMWLESAILEKRNGAWKIAFMTSARVPGPPTPSR
jgi:ketosteroid isomerase-like protein